MNEIEHVFATSPDIRYVAVYRGRQLSTHQRPGLSNASSSESDKYEELFVNPALLKLIEQRGELDCGGGQHLVIRYGSFYQLVIGLPEGHVSVCFELAANPLNYADKIRSIFA